MYTVRIKYLLEPTLSDRNKTVIRKVTWLKCILHVTRLQKIRKIKIKAGEIKVIEKEEFYLFTKFFLSPCGKWACKKRNWRDFLFLCNL